MLGVLVVLFIVQLLVKEATQLIIIILILAFNVFRLISLIYESDDVIKVYLFFAGYTYAILNAFLMKSVFSTFCRFWLILISFLLRFGIIIFIIDDAALQAAILIRGVIVDLFILYFFHSGEIVDRKVFMNFDEKREELLKFKELLADYLPLGITIVDCRTFKPLFSNNAYLKSFEAKVESTNNSSPNLRSEESEPQCYLNKLLVDQTTIRDLGKEQPDFRSLGFSSNFVNFEEYIKTLIKDDLFIENAFSLRAIEQCEINPRSFDVIIKTIKWEGKDVLAVILNDITYQEKLVHWKVENENKDKIIATVSHELRTPLNGILGLLDMVGKRVVQSEALEYISLCKDNAQLLLNLVNSILDLHQIRAGKLKLAISKLNIRKCLRGVVQLFQFQTTHKGITLEVSVDENIPTHIRTDENRLKQIIINLVGNAVKFTTQGGIKILVAENKENPCFLTISVEDTGVGIKEEDISKLFQMYEKLEDKENVNKTGVGLGLTISNVLAIMLSGNKVEKGIQVSSQYGKGSTFSFNVLKNLKLEANLNFESQRKLFQEVAGENRIMNQRKEEINSLNDKSLWINNGIKFEENKCEKSPEIEDVSDESIDFEDVNYKLTKYKSSPMINLSVIKPRFHLSDSLEINERKRNSLPNEIFPFKSMEKVHSAAHVSSQIGNKCILIVDDNPFNLLVTGNLVKELGYITITANGGHEAIKIMEDLANEGQSVKVILMDCQMPIIADMKQARN